MSELTNQEIQALGRAVGLDIQEPELTQVGYSLKRYSGSYGGY